MSETARGRVANVIGTGLIGGSIAAGLRARGWIVHGEDHDDDVVRRAHRDGLIDNIGLHREADITFVAVPVMALTDSVNRAIHETEGIVTYAGSVKSDVASSIDHPRFVPGHPMAGSELDGLDGADPNMFDSAVWVLTPTSSTNDRSFAFVASVVTELGSEVVAVTPQAHDRLVAVVSHLPHLTAAGLMHLATGRSDEHAALLRLAAGGFRDMTRIAAGRPDIWIDICSQNSAAISEALGDMIDMLSTIRGSLDRDDRQSLLAMLTDARDARRNLPGRVTDPTQLCEFRIRIPDRSGAAAEVFTLAAELGVNIANFEVVHMAEGARGLAVVLIEREHSDLFRGGLLARGFHPTVSALS